MSIPCEQAEVIKKIVEALTSLDKNIALFHKDVEYLQLGQKEILERFARHIDDAEKPGGWHSRIGKIETDIETLQNQRTEDGQKNFYFMIGCGIIGGLIGSGATEAVSRFLGIWK